MAELRRALGQEAPLPEAPRLPRIEPPPVRVFPREPRVDTTRFAAEAAKHTTALVGIGAVGTRYATDVVLQFQAELAVAHEAVAAELEDGWAEREGFLEVRSRVTDHREFLLRPDLGRRLDDASRERVLAKAQKAVDVQIIVADGLSAVACRQSGKILHDALAAACRARGLTVGTPIAARFARVWLEDEIGELAQAKVAAILLGERPGLGTGDGLSAYLVYQPKLGRTDGERNMMSNIHARGTPPPEAAEKLATLAAGMIAQRVSGVALDFTKIPGLAGERQPRPPQVRTRLVEVD